jgi:hypothetical protein
MAAGDEQIRLVSVEGLHERLGGVGGCQFLAGVGVSTRFHHGFELLKLIVPNSLLHHVHGELGAAGDLAHHQGLGVAGNAQRVGGVEAGEDAPECVRVGVVVKVTGEGAHLVDEFPTDLFGRHHEADVPGHGQPQDVARLGRLGVVPHHLALVFGY